MAEQDPVGDIFRDLANKKAAAPPSQDKPAPNATPQSLEPPPAPKAPPPQAPAQTQPQGNFWSMTGPGWSPSLQQTSDWMSVAGSNEPFDTAYQRATGQPVDFVKLNADVDAARKRLGPLGSLSADVAGTVVNPTNALSAIPYAGPSLAGAANAALRDYGQGKDWDAIKHDALVGAALGTASKVGATALTNPAFAKAIASRGVDMGGPALAGLLFGSHLGYAPEAGGLTGFGASLFAPEGSFVRKAANAVGEKAGSAAEWLDSHGMRTLIQQLIYGMTPMQRDDPANQAGP